MPRDFTLVVEGEILGIFARSSETKSTQASTLGDELIVLTLY